MKEEDPMKRKMIALMIACILMMTAAFTVTGSADGMTVAMICDSSISDGGWGMACYNAMIDAAAKCGWQTM